jgi:hypothetical protein
MAQALSIQIIAPLSGSAVTSDDVLAQVQVALDCGLPACTGGRLDPERFQITASLFHDDIQVSDSIMDYKRNTGLFEGRFGLKGPGGYVIQFDVYDPETGLAGRNTVRFFVKPG